MEGLTKEVMKISACVCRCQTCPDSSKYCGVLFIFCQKESKATRSGKWGGGGRVTRSANATCRCLQLLISTAFGVHSLSQWRLRRPPTTGKIANRYSTQQTKTKNEGPVFSTPANLYINSEGVPPVVRDLKAAQKVECMDERNWIPVLTIWLGTADLH